MSSELHASLYCGLLLLIAVCAWEWRLALIDRTSANRAIARTDKQRVEADDARMRLKDSYENLERQHGLLVKQGEGHEIELAELRSARQRDASLSDSEIKRLQTQLNQVVAERDNANDVMRKAAAKTLEQASASEALARQNGDLEAEVFRLRKALEEKDKRITVCEQEWEKTRGKAADRDRLAKEIQDWQRLCREREMAQHDQDGKLAKIHELSKV